MEHRAYINLSARWCERWLNCSFIRSFPPQTHLLVRLWAFLCHIFLQVSMNSLSSGDFWPLKGTFGHMEEHTMLLSSLLFSISLNECEVMEQFVKLHWLIIRHFGTQDCDCGLFFIFLPCLTPTWRKAEVSITLALTNGSQGWWRGLCRRNAGQAPWSHV